MKKEYVKPSIDIWAVEVENLLAASPDVVIEKTSESADTEIEVLSKDHNGIWD